MKAPVLEDESTIAEVVEAARAWATTREGTEPADAAERHLRMALGRLPADAELDGVGILQHLLEPLTVDAQRLGALADGLSRVPDVRTTGLPESVHRLAALLQEHRAPVVNVDALGRLLYDIRHKLLAREGREELHGDRVVRYVPVAPALLERLADGLNAALVHLASQVEPFEADPTDLVIFRSDYPASVSARALDMVMSALRRRLDTVTEGQQLHVIAIGSDADLETMSDAQLKRCGLQRHHVPQPMPSPPARGGADG